MMLLALELGPLMGLINTFIGLALGILIGGVLLFMYMNMRVGGLWTWLKSSNPDDPIIINAHMDGASEYRTAKKESGSMVFNAGQTDEFLDRSVIDKKPMMTLHGHRVMLRVTASALPNSPDEVGDIQRVLDHIDENPELYTALKDMQEFEIFGLLGHDPQTAQELMTQKCQVPLEIVGKDGKVIKRDEKEVKEEVANKVKEIMKQAEILKTNLKFLPRHSVYVDLARCIDATQQRIASQILKRYRAEIEALYRAKYGGIENQFWKGALLGVAGGAIAAAIMIKLTGG